ncbi:MAG: AmmeMemoRadiSam system protein B, partial [Thermoplasmata archaeon]
MMRPAEFAKMGWYPGDPKKCKDQIEDFLEKKKPCDSKDILRIGGLVPHAGWFFSGKLACNVISCLKTKENPDTIIIFGKHTTPFGSNSIMKSDEWETPLGSLEIDSELAEKLCEEFYFKVESARYYEPDNTIELQLPFIKYHFPNVKILPIGVVKPEVKSLEIGTKVVKIAQELKRKIKIIGSPDMTHYGPNYGFTPHGIGEEALKWVTEVNDKRMIDLF